jgi:hypothetical protein
LEVPVKITKVSQVQHLKLGGSVKKKKAIPGFGMAFL